MTKDEYQDFALRYKGCGACFPMYHTLSRFEKMWFTAIQKDVAELEKEKCELLGIIQGKDKVIKELKKELNNMLVSKNQQLTKAKEIIKEMLSILPKENIEGIYEITEEAEQFLRKSE